MKTAAKNHPLGAIGAKLMRGVLGLLLVLAGVWAIAAVYFAERLGKAAPLVGVLVAGAFIAVLFSVRGFWRKAGASFLLFLAVLAWFFSQRPVMDADWQADVARLPEVEQDGEILRFRNLRNFDYRSETDFDARYYDAEFDLRRLQTVDLLLCYWGSPHVAHVMTSFGFEDGRYLTFSAETRKKVGQQYSALRGFFRAYELIYVAGDERDLVRLRTNYRGEDVYLYRLGIPLDRARYMLLSYVDTVKHLAEKPEFYNALVDNCATNMLIHTKAYQIGALPLSWKIFASGHLDELAYQLGGFNRSLPFADLKRKSRVNLAAQAADKAEDFSQRIRAGLPFPGVSANP